MSGTTNSTGGSVEAKDIGQYSQRGMPATFGRCGILSPGHGNTHEDGPHERDGAAVRGASRLGMVSGQGSPRSI